MTLTEKPPLWADTPFKLISSTGGLNRSDIPADHAARFFATQMSLIHNSLLRAFNSSYNQAIYIKAAPAPSTAADFLTYNQCIYELLHEHHTVEEETAFPLIEQLTGKPGIMEANVEQHKMFDAGLTAFKDYVFNTKPEDYNGEELRRILDSFGHILQEHLHDEIPTLLGLHIYDSKALMEVWKKTEKVAISNLDDYRHGPLIFGCQDLAWKIDGKEAVLPDCPFFVPYLVKYLHERKYKSLWKFNPSSSFRVRREFETLSLKA
jgi:hypothetical protein